MRSILLALLISMSTVAVAQRVYTTTQTNFYVNPIGSDANDCRSTALPVPPGSSPGACKTLQATWNKIVAGYDFGGQNPQIVLADGTYTSGLVVYEKPTGGHLLSIKGNSFDGVVCPGRDSVVISPPAGTAALWVQDGATVVINCLQINGTPGSIGIQARQHTIIDASWINYGTLGTGISITDHSIVNIGGDNVISGNMTVFASANYFSMIRFTSGMAVTQPVNISYFVMSYTNSFVEYAGGASFGNASYVTGNKYFLWRGGSFAANGIVMPGSIDGTNVDKTGKFFP